MSALNEKENFVNWSYDDMRDNYTGDVGDFGKYILLNELLKNANNKIRLGINWYYNKYEEIANADGRHISYLKTSKVDNSIYRVCSPELYDRLRKIVIQDKRRISEIENSEIFPEDTLFFSTPISYIGTEIDDKIRSRELWFRESMNLFKSIDILFLDPDNGISLDAGAKGRPIGIKYVFTDEIEAYYKSGKSLIVYNHRDRRPRNEYEMKILSVRKIAKSHSNIKVLRFKRVIVRDYIFLFQDHHRELMDQTIKRLTSPPFDFLFEPYHIMEKKT